MIYEKLSENSVFLFSEEIELIFCAQSIFMEESKNDIFSKLYTEDLINERKRSYYFASEIHSALSAPYQFGFLEHLLHYPLKDFSLDEFQAYLLSLSKEDFLMRFFDLREDSDIIDLKEATKADECIEKFYNNHNNLMKSYIAMFSLFHNTDRYIKEFFELARSFKTKEFTNLMEDSIEARNNELVRCQSGLSEMKELEFSQFIMGKTFYNRGPYETFYFAPSFLLPFRGSRFFGKDQILFYNVNKIPVNDEIMLKQLKVIADSTRLKIFALLNKMEPMRGLDIANELKLAPSTVSHHMEQLKSAGLLNEEQVKNSKYYSISRNSVNELLAVLTETLTKKGV
ncbi:ArsR/SmtB family transcription factor [Lachnoclostridium phytofermentans]|uniref:Transcriptional regulator, ArsR family n=1 Tax=Lachnoclostridium phytofermentans (strain ATCC 700394 / DSM 18823 / ISDg) TaxID=357809 RepID=A9KM41_LACP7|nr:metalloregulator ArsR/SmtB family transcription factor [Lachnoclostridium phytofermentans]ABX41384.1 transcriptional regulator, ArsR family [Lachnoclostridium phytofermentans ISDg]